MINSVYVIGSIAYLAIIYTEEIASGAKENASILHPERKQYPLLFNLFGLCMYVQIRIIKCCIGSNGI